MSRLMIVFFSDSYALPVGSHHLSHEAANRISYQKSGKHFGGDIGVLVHAVFELDFQDAPDRIVTNGLDVTGFYRLAVHNTSVKIKMALMYLPERDLSSDFAVERSNMAQYSFEINTDEWADLIAYHLERCKSYRTWRRGKWSFISFIE